MIYIRNLFTQDLRDGKQIAFPTEPSNIFFKFSFGNLDADRKISFKFEEKNTDSKYYTYNGKVINTRLYSANSESRIDGELKEFIRDSLNAKVDDILVFRSISSISYLFEFIPNGSHLYNSYKEILNGRNHEVAIEQVDNKSNDTNSEINELDIKEKFTDWLIAQDGIKHNYFKDSFRSDRNFLLEQLTKYEEVYKEQFGCSIFSLPETDLKEFIEELKENLYALQGDFYTFSLKTSSHMPRAILGQNNYIKFLRELYANLRTASAISPKVDPINKIYFGAPGTGKSFRIAYDLRGVSTVFQKRVTFHPEYDNGSFVGGYKPITNNNGDIRYAFVPQIFTNIYVEACNDSAHQYYLIIEEINRGNCAEIFGELFQLLDRDEKYKITPSDELINHLDRNISNSKFYINGEMLLPDNLSILATMNTSDQSLFPMDSAFKRRWEWEYIPINIDKKDTTNKAVQYKIRIDDNTTVDWIDFIDIVNQKIQNNRNLGMDKCIGNYFVKPDGNNEITLDKFIYKVVFYLWNDVFKDEPIDSIFKENISYQDFFPIQGNGEIRVKSILFDLKLLDFI